jgi:hypothetical protein
LRRGLPRGVGHALHQRCWRQHPDLLTVAQDVIASSVASA